MLKAAASVSAVSSSADALVLADLNAAVTSEVSVTSRSAKAIEPEAVSEVAASSVTARFTAVAVMLGVSFVPVIVTVTSFVTDTPALSVALMV